MLSLLPKNKANLLKRISRFWFSKSPERIEDLEDYQFLIQSINSNTDAQTMLNWFRKLSLSEKLLVSYESNQNSWETSQAIKNSPSLSLINSEMSIRDILEESKDSVLSFGFRELNNYTSLQHFMDYEKVDKQVIDRVHQLKSQVKSDADIANIMNMVCTISTFDLGVDKKELYQLVGFDEMEEKSRAWRGVNSDIKFLECLFTRDYSLDSPYILLLQDRLAEIDIKGLTPLNYLMFVFIYIEVLNAKVESILALNNNVDSSPDLRSRIIQDFVETNEFARFFQGFLNREYDLNNFSQEELSVHSFFFPNLVSISKYSIYEFIPEIESFLFKLILKKMENEDIQYYYSIDTLLLLKICPKMVVENQQLFFKELIIQNIMTTMHLEKYNPVLKNQNMKTFPEEFIKNAKTIFDQMQFSNPQNMPFPSESLTESFDLSVLADLLQKHIYQVISMFCLIQHIQTSSKFYESFEMLRILSRELLGWFLYLFDDLQVRMDRFDVKTELEIIEAKFDKNSEEYHLVVEYAENLKEWRENLLNTCEDFLRNEKDFLKSALVQSGDKELQDNFENVVKVFEK